MNEVKKKILIIVLIVPLIICGTGITYSLFTGNANLFMDQKIAKFVFDAKKTDSIELPLSDIKPGDKHSFNFQVANKVKENVSDVKINYQIILKTFHLMPLEIKLYKNKTSEKLILECDESFSRGENNELICNTTIQDMPLGKETLDDYRLEINYPEIYNTSSYQDLVDYIDIEIRSWQTTGK